MARRTPAASPVPPQDYGVSFSLKQCRNFGIDPKQTLQWLLHDAGFRRFRLMSYWNEHETQPGVYNFKALDWQMDMVAAAGGNVSLCLGARQPRWPENHWPQWAWDAPKAVRTKALLAYVKTVVERYKDHPALHSFQLENEALLQQFGERPEVDRRRLRQEYTLVRSLAPDIPIIMTTSTSWGVPLRRPIPQAVGFSYYQVLWRAGKYRTAFHTPLLHRMRAGFIRLTKRRPSFIHELQLEPWGPRAIWEMSLKEQHASMSPAQIATNLQLARRTHLRPIDLWGSEWWYWRLHVHHDASIWQAVHHNL